MFPKKRSSGEYFITLSHYNRLRAFRSQGSESSSDSFRSDFSETITTSPNPTQQASPFFYHFDEISRAIGDPLSEHISSSSSSWICTLREQKAIVFRRRVFNGEIIQSTLSIISAIRHPSLARLLGVSIEGDHIFIIYEYIPDSASLKQCLNSSSFSNWVSRMQVALDVAKGLEHIHCDCDMVHANIRSSSILVTEPYFNAKIVLFGAASDPAESADDDVEMRAERLAGHWFSIEEPTGYIAPEVLAGGGRMSRESDVFAFGMLILELVSGKIPLEYIVNKITLKCERISVIETAKHAVGSDSDELEMEEERERRIGMWVDQKLEKSFPKGVAEELIRLGLLCVEEDPSLRPEIASVTGTIAKLFQDSIAWEQRGSLAQVLLPGGPSQADRGPSTSNTRSSTATTGRILEAPNLRVFSFAELRRVTKNFKPETVLGEGGFGTVFKGWVDEKTLNPAKSGLGMPVAVKKRNPKSLQGLEEWQSEVNILGRLSHPNFVKLLGYCREDKELLLVYEFMAKGSLYNHLFMRGAASEPLSWSLRLKIAHGAARGLAFLHTSEKQIIYRGFKASNILLDSDYNPKLSDFGLAMNGPTGGDSYVTTQIKGTISYLAPEYAISGHLYVKSDVYGFGVVLLEMLSGQRAQDVNQPTGQHNLVDWAKLFERKNLIRLMDPRLEGQYPFEGALLAAQLTLRCLAGEPESRPSMKEVVENLKQIEAMTSRSRQSREAASQPTTRSHGHSHPATPHLPPLLVRPDGAGPSTQAVHYSPKMR